MNSIRLADGTLLNPVTGKVITEKELTKRDLVEVPTNQQAIKEITAIRRKLHDLPDVPDKMNMPAAILAYTLFGLDDYEIAIALKLPEQRVASIKMSDNYRAMSDAITVSIIEQETDNVRNLFTANARRAANKLTSLVESDNESIALSATRDLLDRAALAPAHIIQHQHSFNGLEIVVNDKRKQPLEDAIEADFSIE